MLTAAGREAYKAAAPVQVEAVERHFGAVVGADEAERASQLCTRVLEHLGARCAWLERDAGRRAA